MPKTERKHSIRVRRRVQTTVSYDLYPRPVSIRTKRVVPRVRTVTADRKRLVRNTVGTSSRSLGRGTSRGGGGGHVEFDLRTGRRHTACCDPASAKIIYGPWSEDKKQKKNAATVAAVSTP